MLHRNFPSAGLLVGHRQLRLGVVEYARVSHTHTHTHTHIGGQLRLGVVEYARVWDTHTHTHT